jgi:hypothetical protein
VIPRRTAAACTAVLVGVLLAACNAAGPVTPRATSSPAVATPSAVASSTSLASTPSPSPDLTPVPGGSTAATPAAASAPTQTDTDWGRIWDTLPAWFPVPPDAVPTETGEEGAVSASLAAGGSARSVAAFMQTGLTGAGFSVEGVNGAAEDGSFVLDATGPDPNCKVEARVRPLSGTTNLVVLYGAGCPFN